MGIFDWVKSMTGLWGPVLLNFYYQYAGWINALVVAYGLLLVLSWQNLSRVRDSLMDQILTQAEEFEGRDKKNPRNIHLSDFKLSWEIAYDAQKFPFMARQSAFIVQQSSLENAKKMISDRDLIKHCYRRLASLGLSLDRGR